MKHLTNVFLICLTLTTICCKKSFQPETTGTNNHNDNVPEWRLYTTTNSKLPSQQINAVVISNSDVKWFGTANGLARLDDKGWTIYNTENSGLRSNIIQALAIQNNGTVWMGTNKGVARFDGTNWTLFNQANSALPSNTVMSLAYDNINNRLWAGTERGLLRIEQSGVATAFEETEGKLPLSMVTDKNGALWIGAHEHISFRGSIIKLDNGVYKSYQLAPMGFESAFPYAIGIANDNTVISLIAGTVVKAVIKFDGSNWEELSQPNGVFGIRAMALQGGQVWVGGQSLSKFGDAKGSIIKLPNNATGVLSMAIDTKGNKWLGTTSDGVAVYHE